MVIELAAAEVLLDAARKTDPGLVRAGLPAHTTVLYPFLPVSGLDERTDRSLRELAASMPAADVTLSEVMTAPGFVGVAADTLQPHTDVFCERWPHLPPYGGRFGPRPRSHVTVAMGAGDGTAEQVAAAVRQLLPVRGRAEGLHLAVFTGHGWHRRLFAPFGGTATAP